jgi:Ca-activated chloride channel family protein
MSFDRPSLLFLLLAVPAAAGFSAALRRRRRRYAVDYTNLAVLGAVARGGATWRGRLPGLLLLVVLVALGLAVAGPQVTRTVPVEQATIVLAIDISRSMQADDVRPSRLAAAQNAAREFLERVPERLRVGLVLFAGDVQVGAVPTREHDVVRRSLRTIETSDVPGTAIGDALVRAVELGSDAVGGPGGARGVVSVLLLSDGSQYLGNVQPDEGTALASAAGVTVHSVLVGTESAAGGTGPGLGPGFRGGSTPGRPLQTDPATLRAIALGTGGEFFAATTEEALASAYADLGSRLGRAPRQTEVTALFVGAAAGLLAAAAALSAAWWPRLP